MEIIRKLIYQEQRKFLRFPRRRNFFTGSKLDVGYGKFKSDSNLTVKENATLSIAYDGTEHGDIIITNGVLDLSATGAKVLVQGKAKTSSGTIDFSMQTVSMRKKSRLI